MRIIAHRGNINGPSVYENQPQTLLKAIEMGYDVECDVRFMANRLWLGHDNADFLLNEDLMEKLIPHAWFHCKDLQSLEYLASRELDYINYFYHEDDKYVVTSHGFVWAYPGNLGGPNTVMVMPELSNIKVPNNVYGVCTDYPNKY